MTCLWRGCHSARIAIQLLSWQGTAAVRTLLVRGLLCAGLLLFPASRPILVAPLCEIRVLSPRSSRTSELGLQDPIEFGQLSQQKAKAIGRALLHYIEPLIAQSLREDISHAISGRHGVASHRLVAATPFAARLSFRFSTFSPPLLFIQVMDQINPALRQWLARVSSMWTCNALPNRCKTVC